MPGTIELIVSPEGETNITVKGVKGSACHALTAGLERNLGASIDRADTAEFYEEPHKVEVDQHRG